MIEKIIEKILGLYLGGIFYGSDRGNLFLPHEELLDPNKTKQSQGKTPEEVAAEITIALSDKVVARSDVVKKINFILNGYNNGLTERNVYMRFENMTYSFRLLIKELEGKK